MRRIRCAIYTRKSSEDGLEQDFNSLDAQREACEAYIASQKHEGWELLRRRYDDGGISGGHLERPALQGLLRAVDEKQIDQIVVYKIDRLTRSLADFAKLVDRLDAAQTAFVSVTQSFNTATSMGRLTLNMLLSFAQFEREVTAERIRDKIAASKRKGMWMGGNPPLGYDADGRTLKVNEQEAAIVQRLYELHLEHRNLRAVIEQARQLDLRSRRREGRDGAITGGKHFDRGHLHYILSNPVYAGRIRHKGLIHEGQHPAIIEPELWDRVQEMLQVRSTKARGSENTAPTSPLAGKLFDETGDRLTPSHSQKNGKRLRYYVSRRLITGKRHQHPDAWRLPAEPIERLLTDVVSKHLSKPDAALSLVPGLDASRVHQTEDALKQLLNEPDLLSVIDRADLRPGQLIIALDIEVLAKQLACSVDSINMDQLTVEAPFQTRRRGVELKLRYGDGDATIDRTLSQNVCNAQKWLSLIIEGKSFAHIAELEGLSLRRVQDLTNLAFLSPEIIEKIATGENPSGLTSDYLIKKRFSAVWSQQHEQFAQL